MRNYIDRDYYFLGIFSFFFALELRYVYAEHVVEQKQVVEQLRNYCKMRKEQFICARLFIHRLAKIEKERIKLEKDFNKILQLWNKSGREIPAPFRIFHNNKRKIYSRNNC